MRPFHFPRDRILAQIRLIPGSVGNHEPQIGAVGGCRSSEVDLAAGVSVGLLAIRAQKRSGSVKAE